jgi:hypothetical protein
MRPLVRILKQETGVVPIFHICGNPLIEVLIFGLTLLSGCGFLGGIYLLLRVLI